MSINDEYELLCRVELFEHLEPVQLKRLIFISQRYHLQASEYLFRQGDSVDKVFAIVAGEFSVILETDQGEVIVARQGPGDLVGDLAVISGEPRSASIRANTVCEVIGFEKELFIDTVVNCPATALKMMQLISQRLINQNEQLAKLSNRQYLT